MSKPYRSGGFQQHVEAMNRERQAIQDAAAAILRRGDAECPERFLYNIYTDGSCPKTGGAGGWAFVVVGPDNQQIYADSGQIYPSTNNTAEMTAIYEGMNWVCEHAHYAPARIITDSKYCQEGICNWLWKWAANDWRLYTGGPVKNQGLWKQMMKLLDVHPKNFLFAWVKGHAGNRWNEMADRMAKARTKEARIDAAEPENWQNFDAEWDGVPLQRPAQRK